MSRWRALLCGACRLASAAAVDKSRNVASCGCRRIFYYSGKAFIGPFYKFIQANWVERHGEAPKVSDFFILPSSRLAGRGGISGRGSSAYKYIYKCIGLEHTARYKAFKRAAYWWGVFSLTGRVGEPNHLLSSGCLFWSAVSAVGSYHSPRVHSLASHRQTNHQPRKNRGPPSRWGGDIWLLTR